MRSFNYTGRKKITHDAILLAIYTDKNGVNTFKAEFDLSGYGFPSESKVVVEAYYQANWMRFNFGTIEQQVPPEKTDLYEFVDAEDVRFRVKITDNDEDKILGLADKIKPIVNDEVESGVENIFPIKSGDLNGAIWKLDYTAESPTLILEKTIGDKNTIFLDEEFLTLVVPAAFREILIRIILLEKDYDLDDNDDWRSKWLIFCKSFGVDEIPNDEIDIEDKYDWIDDVVSRFCRVNKILEKLNKSREESDK